MQKYCFFLTCANFVRVFWQFRFFVVSLRRFTKLFFMNEETKTRLQAIANGETLTAEGKKLVREQAQALGVVFDAKSRCKSCYIDAAILCLLELRKREPAPETERAYVLRDGVDVWFGSIRVNAATLTDEMAADIIARGFKKSYFVKCL